MGVGDYLEGLNKFKNKVVERFAGEKKLTGNLGGGAPRGTMDEEDSSDDVFSGLVYQKTGKRCGFSGDSVSRTESRLRQTGPRISSQPSISFWQVHGGAAAMGAGSLGRGTTSSSRRVLPDQQLVWTCDFDSPITYVEYDRGQGPRTSQVFCGLADGSIARRALEDARPALMPDGTKRSWLLPGTITPYEAKRQDLLKHDAGCRAGASASSSQARNNFSRSPGILRETDGLMDVERKKFLLSSAAVSSTSAAASYTSVYSPEDGGVNDEEDTSFLSGTGTGVSRSAGGRRGLPGLLDRNLEKLQRAAKWAGSQKVLESILPSGKTTSSALTKNTAISCLAYLAEDSLLFFAARTGRIGVYGLACERLLAETSLASSILADNFDESIPDYVVKIYVDRDASGALCATKRGHVLILEYGFVSEAAARRAVGVGGRGSPAVLSAGFSQNSSSVRDIVLPGHRLLEQDTSAPDAMLLRRRKELPLLHSDVGGPPNEDVRDVVLVQNLQGQTESLVFGTERGVLVVSCADVLGGAGGMKAVS